MRALTSKEIDSVSGGIGGIGAVLGAGIGIVGALHNGAGLNGIATAAALGALSGFAGNLAGSAAAGGIFLRVSWGVRSIGSGYGSGVAGSIGTGGGSGSGSSMTSGLDAKDS